MSFFSWSFSAYTDLAENNEAAHTSKPKNRSAKEDSGKEDKLFMIRI
jgi:hypothetical protein